MTGQVFLDRLFPVIWPKFSPYHQDSGLKKKLLAVFTQGHPDGAWFGQYID
jgi:hypothetical protein